jgi:multiple sugar transport system substrate-binding protein
MPVLPAETEPAPGAQGAQGTHRGPTRRAQLRIASLSAAAALVACAGPGQGSGQGGAPAPGLASATVTYAFLGNPVFLQMNQEAGREFEAAHPGLKLELAHMPTGMYDKIQNLYAGGVAPDVWEPDAARFPAWAERGSFADVTALARRDQGKGFDLNDVWPNYRKAAEWQGKLHGVLCRFTVNAFFYNQDLFTRAGLRAPDDAWTWQTMLDAAKRLTGGEQFGFLMANWNHWVWMAGGEVLTERSGKWRSALGAPPAVEALQFLSDLRHTHRVWPTTEQMGGLDAIKLFTTGRLAMSDQRVTRVPDVRAAEGELQWDVGPMPRGKAGRFAWGIGVNRCLSAQSKAPEAGWAFLRFLFTKPHIAAISIPPNMSYARSPAFLEPGKQPRHMSAFLDAIAYSKDFPNHQGRWPDLEVMVNEELNRLWAGEVTARAAGEAIDQKVNAQLSAWGQLA